MWDNYSLERLLLKKGFQLIAGIDEVGRGALAGPVISAAVVLDPQKPIPGIKDSKLLTPLQRNLLAKRIKEEAIAFSLGVSSESEIDQINIFRATKRSMVRAVEALQPNPDVLLIDALHLKEIALPQIKIIKGDLLSASIAAASILAKVTRDDFMVSCGLKHPQYHFSSNKGYGSRAHLNALALYGPCDLHRKTFRGVRETLEKGV